MITNIVVGVVSFVLGGFFWVPVWAWVKAKLFPGSVPITPPPPTESPK